MRVGLISDTHSLLRHEAVDALRGSDRIVHAGDIGDPAILDALAAVAPVTAVRGNNDTAPWADALPDTCLVRIGEVVLYVLHDATELSKRPPGERVDVIVAGHSHRPRIERRDDGVLLVNLGSAGRRRFHLPISVAELRIDGRDVEATIVDLDV